MSQAFSITPEQKAKWLYNSLVFLAPLVLIYLTGVITAIQDGFAWSDFVPTILVQGAMVLYVLNVLMDFFKKFVPATK